MTGTPAASGVQRDEGREGKPLPYTIKDGYVHITVDKVDMFAMVKVDME
jgi:hypothetical protein